VRFKTCAEFKKETPSGQTFDRFHRPRGESGKGATSVARQHQHKLRRRRHGAIRLLRSDSDFQTSCPHRFFKLLFLTQELNNFIYFVAAHCTFDERNKTFMEADHLSVILGMRNRFSASEAKNWQTLTVLFKLYL